MNTREVGTNALAALALFGSQVHAAGATADAQVFAQDPQPRKSPYPVVIGTADQGGFLALIYPLTDLQQVSARTFLNTTANVVPVPRATTANEHVIGELRRYRMLDANWDGEGAEAPQHSSLIGAEEFMRLLPADVPAPAPMLHATGRAGLFWERAGLYADVEFLGDGRATYYVERDGGKHKGVVQLRPTKMPAVLESLLRI